MKHGSLRLGEVYSWQEPKCRTPCELGRKCCSFVSVGELVPQRLSGFIQSCMVGHPYFVLLRPVVFGEKKKLLFLKM